MECFLSEETIALQHSPCQVTTSDEVEWVKQWLLGDGMGPSCSGSSAGFLVADEFGEQRYIWLDEIVQNWDEISPKEKEQFLEYLLYCFMRPRELHEGAKSNSMNRIEGKSQHYQPPPLVSPLVSITFSHPCDRSSDTSNLEWFILTHS